MRICLRGLALLAVTFILPGLGHRAQAQEPPYFVTYSHAMEEPGNLEVEFKGTQASPSGTHAFGGATVEYEYGAKAWWTTELYLSGQTTPRESTVFTGFRWENRFRPLMEEHRVNPVLYVEYEDVNTADRSFLEVVGNDGVGDLQAPVKEARGDVEREMEMKLILSSNARGWNFSENFVSEKNMMGGDPWEFGYALGASRPLTLRAGARECVLCRERFAAGAEMYGGLGTMDSFGLKDTSHYVAPTLAYDAPRGTRFTFSPGFGLNGNSMGVLYRVGVQYEFQQFFSRFHRGEVR
ncbi:MAG TPA: hypothetical protein VJP83_09380 [Terriglobales bacterium]|nr:hypothetical protein [Terriglobales bacterium]